MQHLQLVVLHRGFTGIDIQTVGLLIIRHFPAFISDYANRGQYTDEMAKDMVFVRTPEAEEAMLQYVENKVPLALKRTVAAHRFLNKICFPKFVGLI